MWEAGMLDFTIMRLFSLPCSQRSGYWLAGISSMAYYEVSLELPLSDGIFASDVNDFRSHYELGDEGF